MIKILAPLFVVIWFIFSISFFCLLFDLLTDLQLSLWGKYAILVMASVLLFFLIIKEIAQSNSKKRTVIAESFVFSMYFVISVFFWSLMTLKTILILKRKGLKKPLA